LKLQTDTFSW